MRDKLIKAQLGTSSSEQLWTHYYWSACILLQARRNSLQLHIADEHLFCDLSGSHLLTNATLNLCRKQSILPAIALR